MEYMLESGFEVCEHKCWNAYLKFSVNFTFFYLAEIICCAGCADLGSNCIELCNAE